MESCTRRISYIIWFFFVRRFFSFVRTICFSINSTLVLSTGSGVKHLHRTSQRSSVSLCLLKIEKNWLYKTSAPCTHTTLPTNSLRKVGFEFDYGWKDGEIDSDWESQRERDRNRGENRQERWELKKKREKENVYSLQPAFVFLGTGRTNHLDKPALDAEMTPSHFAPSLKGWRVRRPQPWGLAALYKTLENRALFTPLGPTQRDR